MSLIGVLIATVASQLLSAFWYSNNLFGGFVRGHRPATSDNRVYLSSIVAMFCLALFMDGRLETYFGIQGLYNTIRFALAVTIPCQLLQIPHAGFEGRKIAAYFIDAGFDALVLVVICVIVSLI